MLKYNQLGQTPGERVASLTLQRQSQGSLRASLHAGQLFHPEYLQTRCTDFLKPRTTWASSLPPLFWIVSDRDNLASRISFRVTCYVPI